MSETIQFWTLFAVAAGVMIDAVHRACAWPGPTVSLAAVVLNGVYAAAGAAVGVAPFLPPETWPGLLSGLMLSAAGLWAVTRGRRA